MIITCIMEVRPGQRTSTIVQAFAHNLKTIESDIEMLRPLLRARGETEVCDDLDVAYDNMHHLYEHLLHIFGTALRNDVAKHGDTADPDAHHHERPASDIPNLPDHHHPHPEPHIKRVDEALLQDAGLADSHAARVAAVRAARYETR